MMSKIFNKIKSFWQKPKVIIVTSDNREMIKGFICQILGNSFNVNKEVLIVNPGEKINLSAKIHLVLNFDVDELRSSSRFADARAVDELRSSSRFADARANEDIRALKGKMPMVLTFGFQQGADFQASDLRQNGRDYINFKINHKGNIVPIWLEKYSGKEQIYAALAAIAVGTIFGLNLVEISQALKA